MAPPPVTARPKGRDVSQQSLSYPVSSKQSHGCSWGVAARCGSPSRLAWLCLPVAVRMCLWPVPADTRGDSSLGLPRTQALGTRVCESSWGRVFVSLLSQVTVELLGRGTCAQRHPTLPGVHSVRALAPTCQRRRARPPSALCCVSGSFVTHVSLHLLSAGLLLG